MASKFRLQKKGDEVSTNIIFGEKYWFATDKEVNTPL